MSYVVCRNGYVGQEYLNPEGEWSRHKVEAVCFYGQRTAQQAIKMLKEKVTYPIWVVATKH
jgi:hypothetical protein